MLSKNAKIYIAGHRGLVGSAIHRRLQADEYHNLITRTHADLDLTNQAAVNAFFEKEKPEYVFLAAAKVGGIGGNSAYPADFIYVNLAIQNNVLHAAWQYNVKKLLLLGSSCIYPKHCPQPMREEHLLSGYLEPTNEPYAVAKIAGIKMCQAFNRQYGTRFISVMPTNLYGLNDNYDLETSHVLPAMIRKFHLAKLALKGDWETIQRDEATYGTIPADIKTALGIDTAFGKPLKDHPGPEVILWGSGTPRRELLHSDDLADACLFLMNTYEDSEIINIGYGKDFTVAELAAAAARAVGYDGPIKWDTTKPDGTPLKLLDHSRLESLGWTPKIDLDTGIRSTYAAY
jgi:GDP-L-fucose synthase